MKWQVSRDEKSGWFRASATKHFSVEVARLFSILNDPDSWSQPAPRTRINVVANTRLGYAFANGTKADIAFETVNSRVTKVTIEAYNLHDETELEQASSYWHEVIAQTAARTLSQPVTVFSAPGKLNLFFSVGALRPDGYHDVASIYQAVNLRETVVAEHSANWSVEARGDLSPIHIAAVPTGEENLVVKAAKALAKAAHINNPLPITFSIEKQVPVAGGMGGGSADAAAAIAATNQLWGNPLSKEQVQEVAASVGADVPFSLAGGLAIGTSIGDKLDVLRQKGEYHWALVIDELGLSTPLVFKRLDELRSKPGESPENQPVPQVPARLLSALKRGAIAEDIAPMLHNDLQAAALSLRPELQRILELAKEVDALTAILSGSGPTIAFLARSKPDAEAVASRLRTRGLKVIVTSSPAAGTEAVD